MFGVDEFSLRRSQTYANVLMDLERRRPIDVIDGRDAKPMTEWLRCHRGNRVLVRDRSEAYALAGLTVAHRTAVRLTPHSHQ